MSVVCMLLFSLPPIPWYLERGLLSDMVQEGVQPFLSPYYLTMPVSILYPN